MIDFVTQVMPVAVGFWDDFLAILIQIAKLAKFFGR